MWGVRKSSSRIVHCTNSSAVPVGGLMHGELLSTWMGSNVGSSSRMSWLSLSKEMSSSLSSWLPLGSERPECWLTVSGAGSRRIVCPTLRTWLGIIWAMPVAVGITVFCDFQRKRNNGERSVTLSSLELQIHLYPLKNRAIKHGIRLHCTNAYVKLFTDTFCLTFNICSEFAFAAVRL